MTPGRDSSTGRYSTEAVLVRRVRAERIFFIKKRWRPSKEMVVAERQSRRMKLEVSYRARIYPENRKQRRVDFKAMLTTFTLGVQRMSKAN